MAEGAVGCDVKGCFRESVIPGPDGMYRAHHVRWEKRGDVMLVVDAEPVSRLPPKRQRH